MPTRYCLDLPSPAAGFMDSFLIGNGRLGATMRGGIGCERIDLNLDRLWSGGPETGPEEPSPAPLLTELRAAIRAGDFARADALSRQMQGKGWTQSFQPVGGLLWTYSEAQAPKIDHYVRRLDMQNGVVRVTFENGQRVLVLEGFVSAPENVAVFSVKGDAASALAEMALEWDCPHPADQKHWTEGDTRYTVISGRVPAQVVPPYVHADDPIKYWTDIPDARGQVDKGMGFAAVAALEKDRDDTIRLVVAVECGFRGYLERPSADLAALAEMAKARVKSSLKRSTQALRTEHIADHRSYFDRADLKLPSTSTPPRSSSPAEAELLFHFGRYLLIASSRQGTEPANLQGIWNPYRRPAWSSNHTININTQMNYWPAELTGLGDLVEPLVTMVEELVRAGKQSAAYYYAAPGTVAHHNTDLWRFTRPVQGTPVWANWTGSLPWLASHLWDHWEYGSATDEFAQARLLPLYAEIVRFVLFMLVQDQHGDLVVSPSSSPEHLFLGADGKPWGVSEGSTMDQELAGEILDRFVVLCHRFVSLDRRYGTEMALARKAIEALTRLRKPQADADGRLMEWAPPLKGAEPGHRHLSHLYGLHPGHRIYPGSDSPYTHAVRAALDDRLAHGTGHTGWSQSWVLCMAARLGDHKLASDAIDTLLGKLTTRALLVLHPYEGMPDNAVFQIDGNFGATAGITEMLLQSTAETIFLLRALPESWDTGAFGGLRARGGHVVSAEWTSGAVTFAEVTAQTSTALALDIPEGPGYQVILADSGAMCPSTSGPGISAGRTRIVWQSKAGVLYRIVPAG